MDMIDNEQRARREGLNPQIATERLESMLAAVHAVTDFFNELLDNIVQEPVPERALWMACTSEGDRIFRRKNQHGLTPNARYPCGLKHRSLKTGLDDVTFTDWNEETQVWPARRFYMKVIDYMSVCTYHSESVANSYGLDLSKSEQQAKTEETYDSMYRVIIGTMEQGHKPYGDVGIHASS